MMEQVHISIHDAIHLIEEKLDANGEVTLIVTGNSMLPFLVHQKTRVTLVAPTKAFKSGDIVFYRYPNQTYVLHRIVRVKKNELLICGDALKIMEHVQKEWILAVVKHYQYGDTRIDCENLWYRLRVKFWLLLRPIRKYIMKINRMRDHHGII